MACHRGNAMTRLTDVNTTDITGAIKLARNAMCGIFDPNGDDVPYFRVVVRPQPYFGQPWESHVPGRHLNALLNAEDAAGLEVDETYIEKFASACFYSYGGPIPFPLDRNDGEYDSPVVFNPHHIREGFHALNALVKYRASERAAEVAAASITAVFEYWDPDADWDYGRLEDEGVVPMRTSQSFITGVARAIGPLVKYYRTTGYPPALDLAIALKEKCLDGYFTRDGSYDPRLFGAHAHSVTCTMSSLAQLADLTQDSTLMDLVKAFYDNGLWEMRDETGWSRESAVSSGPNPDEGEMNNTGDILETALILGRWGYVDYFHDAERILRCHLLPSQLRDISWIPTPGNPDGLDTLRDVAGRTRGLGDSPRRSDTSRWSRGTAAHTVQHRRGRRDGRVTLRGAAGDDAIRRNRALGQPAIRSRNARHRGAVGLYASSPQRAGQEAWTALRPRPALVRPRQDADIRGCRGAAPNERVHVLRAPAGQPADHLPVRSADRGDHAASRHARHPRAPARRRGGRDGEPRSRFDLLRAAVGDVA